MTKPKKILIVGNGFGGVYALKNLHKFFHKDKRVELSLIGDENYFLFTPLLHEVATGSISPENIIEPIRSVLKCCLNNFYLGRVEFVNTKDKRVVVGELILPYDYLILAPGAETNFYNIPGAEKYSLPLKSVEDAIKIKNHCITQMEEASHITDRIERKKKLAFVIVGGGPTGVELAAELHELIKESFSSYYAKEVIEDARVVLVERGSELVMQFGEKVRRKSLQVLQKKGVEIMLNTAVKEITESDVLLQNDTKIPTETVIWVAGIKPADIKFDKEVKKSPDGKIMVNEYLQVENSPEIFAIGDVALFMQKNSNNVMSPIPALAQVAEKEALNVAKNIQLLINGKELQPFSYHHLGDFISLGQWMAIGEISRFTFWGHITWWMWRMVYLSKLISWRKKMEVAIDWTTNIFSPRDISEL